MTAGNTDGVTRWPHGRPGKLIALPNTVASVATSDDGALFAAGSREGWVRVWRADLAEPRPIVRIPPPADGVYPHSVMGVAFHPTTPILASGSYDGSVRLWGVDETRHDARLSGHTDAVHTVAFSRDGKLLASGAWDGTARLWDVARQQPVGRATIAADGIQHVTFANDGAWLVTSECVARARSADPEGRWRYGACRLWTVDGGGGRGHQHAERGDDGCLVHG